ncbi:MAG: hypothetical protein QF632_05445 [Candidatus Woesearchaeota archaeon]|jgi:hypothetical protein|nr:hypothetical protein [Candidatus Woesearchaeota archaeon]
MIDLSTKLLYYKRADIQQAILECAKDKEVSIRFGDKGFGKRPDILKYPSEIVELVMQGATSFHCSEELWKNVMHINSELKRGELDTLRKGWDLVLDIDCQNLDISGIAADLLVKALRHHGIQSVSCKFSGNHGFHIAVPFEAFPETVEGVETRTLFPEGPRKIAGFLGHMIQDHLRKILLEKYSVEDLVEISERKKEEVIVGGVLDPFKVVDIDTVLIASRHLYRMPYSFNEKSGLVSIPIHPDRVLQFNKAIATAKNAKVSKFIFLDRESVVPGEGAKLIREAIDFHLKEEIVEALNEKEVQFEEIAEKVPQEMFPPCIKIIEKGMQDGKKRAVFILINFLTRVGWSYDDIEEYLKKWNANNLEPLREVNLLGQVRYHKQKQKKVLPPNCDNQNYYTGLGCCKPDGLCKRIKNPVTYVRRRVEAKADEPKPRVKKTDDKKQVSKVSNKEKGSDSTKSPIN